MGENKKYFRVTLIEFLIVSSGFHVYRHGASLVLIEGSGVVATTVLRILENVGSDLHPETSLGLCRI